MHSQKNAAAHCCRAGAASTLQERQEGMLEAVLQVEAARLPRALCCTSKMGKGPSSLQLMHRGCLARPQYPFTRPAPGPGAQEDAESPAASMNIV